MSREAHAFELDVCERCEHTFRRPTPEMIGSLAIEPVLRVSYRVKVGDWNAKYFSSRKGAYRSYARRRMAQKYPCEGSCMIGPDGEEMVFARRCNRAHFDGTQEEQDRVWNRFVRWLLWHDRETRKRGRSPFDRSAPR